MTAMDPNHFAWCFRETYEKIGPPPKIADVPNPIVGDLARDEDGKLKVWFGTEWR